MSLLFASETPIEMLPCARLQRMLLLLCDLDPIIQPQRKASPVPQITTWLTDLGPVRVEALSKAEVVEAIEYQFDSLKARGYPVPQRYLRAV